MRTHTNDFKERISRFGRELDSKITYTLNSEEIELGNEQLNSVSMHYEGAILKSVMKQLDVDSNVDIPLDTVINYQFGVKVNNSYDYIDYGNFIVYKSEKQEDTNSYKITCYDKMLYAMKDYETPKVSDVLITYPITVKDYLQAICNHLGLAYTYVAFANDSKEIPEELYLDEGKNTLGYTFRDVLDEIAEVSGSTICINEDDELEVRYIKKLLPDEYQQIEYISKSETTQRNAYLDTLLYPAEITKIKLDASFDAVSQSGGSYFIGGYYQTATEGSLWYSHLVLSRNNYIGIGYKSNWMYSDTKWNVGERHRLETTLKSGEQTVILDGTTIYQNTLVADPPTVNRTVPLMVYQYGTQRLTTYGWSGKIYSLKIYGTNDQLIRDYVPCYRKSDNVAGMYDLVNGVFYTNAGSSSFSVGNDKTDGVDTIDEENLKDINVNFGEKFGPVNTIVLSRGGDGDKISLSIPSNLPDADKIAIQITDNQIMNGNNRDTYMADILDKLYGLEYYINDFSSTGVCYLDLCDMYGVKVDNTTYSCIMFNDEVNITQGLEEMVHTESPDESEQEYQYMSSNDRGITQANIIAKKNEGIITETTSKLNDVVNGLNEVKTTQTDTNRTIEILGKNIDEDGNITAVKVKEGFTFDENGLQIYADDNSFKTQIDETGTYYYDGTTKVAEYTKEGSKQKDLRLFGVYYYGMKTITDTPMFVAQLYTDEDGEECFGHFYNRG